MGSGRRVRPVCWPLVAVLLLPLFRETDSSYPSGAPNSLLPPATVSPHHALPGRGGPYFDPLTARNVTALAGKSAYLTCRVRQLGNRTVSWVRHRDLHILTVGGYTYTSDQRFQASHHRDNDEWTLHIKWAQKRDAGVYECQVSTQPVRSFAVTLNIVVPTAAILGGPDLYVNKGSTINLTCTIRYSPEPPAYIFWYHHDKVISYDSIRGGVSVVTDKGEETTSRLLLQNARPTDSGPYSCRPSNADVAGVNVHVLDGHPRPVQTVQEMHCTPSDADIAGVVVHILDGERPEAMQTGAAMLPSRSNTVAALTVAAFIAIMGPLALHFGDR